MTIPPGPRFAIAFCTAAIAFLTASAAHAAINLNVSQTNVACFGDSTGSASIFPSGGVAPYTYAWSTGATSATVSGLAASSYSVTVTDSLAEQASTVLEITEPPALVASAVAQSNVACFGGSNGSATVGASGGAGAYTYSWSPSGGTGATTSGRSAGTYTVTVTDANACTATQSFTITQPTALVATPVFQTNIACNGDASGAAGVNASGGVGGYTYAWSPSGGTAASASSLEAGTYTVTVTDANACTAARSFTLTQPTSLVASPLSQTNIACNGGANGDAAVSVTGGTPGYSYFWSPSGGTAATASGLSAGTYTVTVLDAYACTTTQSFTLTQPAPLVASPASQTNVACNGDANGSAAVGVAGGTPGYTYSWAPAGGTAATASGLAAGTFTVTVTDANSCQATQGFSITEPPALTATPSHTDVSCFGGSNGSAEVAASGGTGTLSYQWDSGQTTSSISGLSAGTYDITVTDANTCSQSQSIVVDQPAEALVANVVSVTNVTCNGDADGGATVQAAGGTPAYTYAWSPAGGTSDTLSAQGAGTYSVTVTDAQGCTATNNVSVAEPDVIAVSLASSTPNGCGDVPSGSLGASVSGGNGGYVYEWTPGDPTGDGTVGISGLVEGSYTLSVQDMYGCTEDNVFDVVFMDDAAPVAVEQSVSVVEDGSVNVTLAATYTGCQPLVYEIATDPAHGALGGTPPNLTYHPDLGYVGDDTFEFQVVADDQVSAIAVVSLTVMAAPEEPVDPVDPNNQRPVASAFTVVTDVGTAVTFTLSGADAEGDALTYVVQTSPQFGTLSGEAPLLTYTPFAANAYEDRFWYAVHDGTALSAPALLVVQVGEPQATTRDDDGEDPMLAGIEVSAGCNATANSDVACLGAIVLLLARALARRRNAAVSL